MDQPECYRLFTSQTSGYAATAPETPKKGDRLFINSSSMQPPGARRGRDYYAGGELKSSKNKTVGLWTLPWSPGTW